MYNHGSYRGTRTGHLDVAAMLKDTENVFGQSAASRKCDHISIKNHLSLL